MSSRLPRLVHVLTLPSEGVAEVVAAGLREEGFDPVDVLGGPGGMAVRIADPRLPDADGAAATEALKVRFDALAAEHEGTYDGVEEPHARS